MQNEKVLLLIESKSWNERTTEKRVDWCDKRKRFSLLVLQNCPVNPVEHTQWYPLLVKPVWQRPCEEHLWLTQKFYREMKVYYFVLWLCWWVSQSHCLCGLYEHVKSGIKQVFEAQIFTVNRQRSYFWSLSLLDMKLKRFIFIRRRHRSFLTN